MDDVGKKKVKRNPCLKQIQNTTIPGVVFLVRITPGTTRTVAKTKTPMTPETIIKIFFVEAVTVLKRCDFSFMVTEQNTYVVVDDTVGTVSRSTVGI